MLHDEKKLERRKTNLEDANGTIKHLHAKRRCPVYCLIVSVRSYFHLCATSLCIVEMRKTMCPLRICHHSRQVASGAKKSVIAGTCAVPFWRFQMSPPLSHTSSWWEHDGYTTFIIILSIWPHRFILSTPMFHNILDPMIQWGGFY